MSAHTLTHAEWFAFIELLTGLREDTPSLNPRSVREIRFTAHDLAGCPNPFDEIAALREQNAALTGQVAALTKKATTNAKQGPTRTKRSA
jgi:hypothetical protein|tara:strand:+ start:13068 stop:13337 length:270 start_codon:yes stop_codon:yes gene_type:complete